MTFYEQTPPKFNEGETVYTRMHNGWVEGEIIEADDETCLIQWEGILEPRKYPRSEMEYIQHKAPQKEANGTDFEKEAEELYPYDTGKEYGGTVSYERRRLEVRRQRDAYIKGRQLSYQEGWIKVTPETMPTKEVLLLTSSQLIIIGYWYDGGWHTHRSEWVSRNDGTNFKKLQSAYKFEEIIAWMPLPLTPHEQSQKLRDLIEWMEQQTEIIQEPSPSASRGWVRKCIAKANELLKEREPG